MAKPPKETSNFLESLLSLPAMYFPRPSPDGRWVAWLWLRAGPAGDVYIGPTDGSQPPIRLTETPDDTWPISWTPDSRSVLVSEDRDGNERRTLYRVDLKQPGRMKTLTAPEPEYFLRGGELHVNGRWLVYGANFDFDLGKEIEQTWIYRLDLETGEQRPLARPEQGGYIRPRLSPTGTHILYPRQDRHPGGVQTWLVDIEGQGDREILNVGDEKKCHAFWFPDGKRAVVLAEAESHRKLGVWDLTTETVRWLIDDPDRNIESATAPHGSSEIVVLEIQAARTRASFLDPVTGSERRLPEVPGNLIPLAPTEGGEWVGQTYSARQPGDLVRFSLADPKPAAQTSLSRVWDRTDLAPTDLAPAEDFRWTGEDGLPIQGWLYRAKGKPKGTIVYVHGGPTSHSQDKINPQIQLFVRNSFNVLDPNYRGSTGFGLAFIDAIKTTGWGGLEQTDIRRGIEALSEAGIAEPGKIGITGTSYGGYSSWCAATRFPRDLLAAAAPICGMTDLVVDYETTRPDLRPYSAEMMGGTPDEVPDRYRERSPIHFVDRIQAQLLIVQGAQDPNVTPENVRIVRDKLDGAGIPYELLVFEDEGHGVYKPKNLKVLYERLLQFFLKAFSR